MVIICKYLQKDCLIHNYLSEVLSFSLCASYNVKGENFVTYLFNITASGNTKPSII